MWEQQFKYFSNYCKLERSFSKNTISSYLSDLSIFKNFVLTHFESIGIYQVNESHIKAYIHHIHSNGVEPSSQARAISSLKAFFKFLLAEEIVQIDPMEMIDTPKISRKIPDVLTFEEIELLLHCIDLSTGQGLRNRAMLESLYASGLRVTELINLTFDDYHPKEGFLRIIGKGNKQRLVPIGEQAIKHIDIYVENVRKLQKVELKNAKYIFLNQRSKPLSRVYVFMVIKELAIAADIQKSISPHTFRHSFATHLIEGGANLKAVQDMLGHESITTTEIYTHLDNDYLRETLLKYHPMHKK